MNPMTVARALYRAVVPIDLRRMVRTRISGPPPLSGLYADVSSPPVIRSEAFASTLWLDYVCRKAVEIQRIVAAGGGPQFHHHVVASLLASRHLKIHGSCRILDFGGGVGEIYPFVVSALTAKERQKVCYTVIDGPQLCERGRLCHADVDIRFVSSVQDAPGSVDLCIMFSVLQYIPEWESVVHDILVLRPIYLVIGRHLSADGAGSQTYFTIQNVAVDNAVCGQQVVTLFDRTRLVALLDGAGYAMLGDYLLDGRNGIFDDAIQLPFTLNERTLVFMRLDGAPW